MNPQEEEQFVEKVNTDYFKEASGAENLKELEALSLEMSLKFQKMERLLSDQDREELTRLLTKFEEIFEQEEEDEESSTDLVQVKLGDEALKHQEVISSVASEGFERISNIVGAFEQDLSELQPAEGEVIAVSAVDICHLTASCLDKILMESLRTLSQLSAASVAQLLKVVRSFKASLEAGDVDRAEAENQALYLHQVSHKLAEELSRLSGTYNENLRSVGEKGVRLFEKIAQQNKEKSEECDKCTEDIDNKTNAHANHVYLETSNAVSNIQDCRKFLFAVSKTLMLDVVLGEKLSQSKVNVKKVAADEVEQVTSAEK